MSIDWRRQETFSDVEALEDALSDPTPGVIETMRRISGDIIILGVGGKMGPTLARMARRAADAAGTKRKVIGVARFSEPDLEQRLESWGIQTIKADLLNQQQLDKLPDAPNVIYMAGMKFGSTGKEALTWAMNTYLPGMVAQRYSASRIAAFSTGNIYGLSPVVRGGPTETDPLNPVGDYATSCMGRERILEHFALAQGTKTSLIRLNYACELRYGVLVDLARNVYEGRPVGLGMGNFNVIWQGDANAMSIQSLEQASSPAFPVNITGPEIMSSRRVCAEFGRIMGKSVVFEGTEAPDALLNNGQLSHRLYGYPSVSVNQMIQWVADWVMRGGKSLGKPTHFEARDGKF